MDNNQTADKLSVPVRTDEKTDRVVNVTFETLKENDSVMV
jgi:hypothetical protein